MRCLLTHSALVPEVRLPTPEPLDTFSTSELQYSLQPYCPLNVPPDLSPSEPSSQVFTPLAPPSLSTLPPQLAGFPHSNLPPLLIYLCFLISVLHGHKPLTPASHSCRVILSTGYSTGWSSKVDQSSTPALAVPAHPPPLATSRIWLNWALSSK